MTPTFEPSYILTQAQLDELMTPHNEPDQLLRDTNSELKRKLDVATKALEQGSWQHTSVDTPFNIIDDTLILRSVVDFAVLYNNLSKPALGDTDKAVFDYLSLTAGLFNLKPQFSEQSKLKAHRVNLQKKGLYQPSKYAGRTILTKPE